MLLAYTELAFMSGLIMNEDELKSYARLEIERERVDCRKCQA